MDVLSQTVQKLTMIDFPGMSSHGLLTHFAANTLFKTLPHNHKVENSALFPNDFSSFYDFGSYCDLRRIIG